MQFGKALCGPVIRCAVLVLFGNGFVESGSVLLWYSRVQCYAVLVRCRDVQRSAVLVWLCFAASCIAS